MSFFEKEPPSPAEAIAGFEASIGMSIEQLEQMTAALAARLQQQRESLAFDEVKNNDTLRSLIEEEIALIADRHIPDLEAMKQHFMTMRADHERIVEKYRNSDPSLQ